MFTGSASLNLYSARGVARRSKTQLAGGICVEQVTAEHTTIDYDGAPRGNAFIVERRRSEKTRDGAVIDDGDILGCDALAQFARQEGSLAIDRLAIDGLEDIAEERAGRELIEDHGDLLGRHFT